MILVLPTAEELRDEQRSVPDDMDGRPKDSSWTFKFTDNSGVEPADVHGA
ncbi:hypothetical protein GA0070606_0528 [Micromonospora citrea]|uniref:Uncharacterized protein n=1 Tax=Micromonospora citrea TaxID=47855 RepID=A0A1C6TTE1_9ACTN|nr:hypothetical protein [Micromonospora citrea]SCL44948.1 hypothetical protein GA0070606_0528 [Micromonospora citrea]